MDEVMEECTNKGMPLDQSCRSVQEQKCEPSTTAAASTSPVTVPSAPAAAPSAPAAAPSAHATPSSAHTTEPVVSRSLVASVVLVSVIVLTFACVLMLYHCMIHKREKKRPFLALAGDSVEMLDLRSDGGY